MKKHFIRRNHFSRDRINYGHFLNKELDDKTQDLLKKKHKMDFKLQKSLMSLKHSDCKKIGESIDNCKDLFSGKLGNLKLRNFIKIKK